MLQAFVDAFPKAHQPVTALMADTQLRRLRKVMDNLLALAHTTRQHKVSTLDNWLRTPSVHPRNGSVCTQG